MRTMTGHDMERISKSLGRIPSGCAILTASAAGRQTGMLASWIQQAGFEPPMLSAAIKKGRAIESLINASEAFVVNVLGENPTALFKHFGKGFTIEEDAFAGLAITEVPGGIALAEALCWLSVEVQGKHAAGDHWLYIGEVIGADIGEFHPPYVHVRKNGLSY